jgi:TonB family protein
MRLSLLLLLVGSLYATPTVPRPVRVFEPHVVQRAIKYTLMEKCEANSDPEPADTPNPLLNEHEDSVIVIDFIIGENGKINSPILLQGLVDGNANREALRTLKTWRFKPALCNETPSSAEGLAVFY